MAEFYLWIKALHILAVISWMAGLLYLPRIFVYHTQAEKGGEADGIFKVMERKLHKYIMNPAMVTALVTGLALVVIVEPFSAGKWFHIKSLLLIFLLITHVQMGYYIKKFARGENDKSEKFFRVYNEIPTLLMIGIVVFVVTKSL